MTRAPLTQLPFADLAEGDCFDCMESIPSASVNLVLADLPYGVLKDQPWDKKLDLSRFWREVERILTPSGTVLMFGTQPFTSELVASNLKWFKYEAIWQKSNGRRHMHAKRRLMPDHENLLVFSRGSTSWRTLAIERMTFNPQGLIPLEKPKENSRVYKLVGGGTTRRTWQTTHTNYPRTIMSFDAVAPRAVRHPTEKPVSLLAYLIKSFSNPGEVVLDPTCGSGSTGEAAIMTGRSFIGIERDPRFFEVSRDRLAGLRKADVIVVNPTTKQKEIA